MQQLDSKPRPEFEINESKKISDIDIDFPFL